VGIIRLIENLLYNEGAGTESAVIALLNKLLFMGFQSINRPF
jgi:hypothetical protein